MHKMIHDIFPLGSGVVYNEHKYTLNEIMIGGTSEILYSIISVTDKDGGNTIYGVDIEKNAVIPVSIAQREFHHEIVKYHKKRLIKSGNAQIFNYKAEYNTFNFGDIIKK